MRSAFIVVAVVATVAGCATPSSQFASHGPRPFSISSENGGFTVRGKLVGTLDIRPTEIVIVVTTGTVISSWDDQPAVRLRPMIAGPTQGEVAERVAEFDAQPIGAFLKESPRAFTGPLTFKAPIPAKFDPRNQWLVFEFQLEKRRTTYACEIDNLVGPDPSGPKRNGQVCWASR